MKILIISQYYFPEQFQVNEIAPELVRRGHQVSVVCGVPNYPKGVVFEGYETQEGIAAKEKEYEEQTGVKVVHVPQIPRGHHPIKLLRNYWSFVRNGKKVVRELEGDFDVVLGYQLSPITSMIPALEYKKLHGTPVVFYTLDIWPASSESMLHGKKNPLYVWVKWLSKRIYQEADRILVTSRPFIDYLHRMSKIPVERMAYLPQHAGTEMLTMDLEAETSDVRNFMFAGNLGKGQWVHVIIQAAAILGKRDDYKIHIVGDGRQRESLEKMVRENGLTENIIFYGNQKREDMPSFYRKADVLIITLRGNNEVGNTMPGKLQMYMTTGKPVIGAINGAACEIIEEARCGSCVKAGDYKGLAGLMDYYINHPENCKLQGDNGRKYFKEHFTLEKYMDGLEKELTSMLVR